MVNSLHSRTQADFENEEADLETAYVIDVKAFERSGKSFSYAVSTRLCGHCAACQSDSDEKPVAWRTPSDLMKRITSNCKKEADYLMPGTPITEAVFRLLLANNNRPMKLSRILSDLSAAWASVIYLKNLSDTVLQRMLDEPTEYHIVRAEDQA